MSLDRSKVPEPGPRRHFTLPEPQRATLGNGLRVSKEDKMKKRLFLLALTIAGSVPVEAIARPLRPFIKS